jgi:hypothetical protein
MEILVGVVFVLLLVGGTTFGIRSLNQTVARAGEAASESEASGPLPARRPSEGFPHRDERPE